MRWRMRRRPLRRRRRRRLSPRRPSAGLWVGTPLPGHSCRVSPLPRRPSAPLPLTPPSSDACLAWTSPLSSEGPCRREAATRGSAAKRPLSPTPAMPPVATRAAPPSPRLHGESEPAKMVQRGRAAKTARTATAAGLAAVSGGGRLGCAAAAATYWRRGRGRPVDWSIGRGGTANGSAAAAGLCPADGLLGLGTAGQSGRPEESWGEGGRRVQRSPPLPHLVAHPPIVPSSILPSSHPPILSCSHPPILLPSHRSIPCPHSRHAALAELPCSSWTDYPGWGRCVKGVAFVGKAYACPPDRAGCVGVGKVGGGG